MLSLTVCRLDGCGLREEDAERVSSDSFGIDCKGHEEREIQPAPASSRSSTVPGLVSSRVTVAGETMVDGGYTYLPIGLTGDNISDGGEVSPVIGELRKTTFATGLSVVVFGERVCDIGSTLVQN